MQRQPDRGLIRCRPFDSVLFVGRDIHEIPRLQLDGLVLETESCCSCEYTDPLVLILVVPESIGRGLAVGDDSLDANVRVLSECFGQFLGQRGWKVGQEVRYTL